jgi:hypothetical protein
VINNGEHLLHLINSILDISKVEAGKMENRPELFNLEDLVLEVKNSISPLINKKRQNFSLQIQSPLPICQADPRKIRQILLNLLSNSIKFTPEGGNISLTVDFHFALSKLHFPEGEKLPDSPKGYFQMVVEDNGIGIDSNDLKSIFNLFEQIDSSLTRKYQGTGLGLALTKQFVEMHHGIIWAESQRGEGAKFSIIIPAQIELCQQDSNEDGRDQ